MQPPSVRSATPAERDLVLQTVVLGFGADPLNRWFLGRAATYLKTARPLFDAFGGGAIEAGSAYVTDNFEGAALWLPPGVEPDDEPIGPLLAEAIVPELIEDALRLFGEMQAYHPTDPVWYLPLIAVDPAYQGRGLGSALMKHALSICDETNTPAYLESSNPQNMSLYERHGFKTMGQIQVGTSPPVHPMIREP